MKTPMLNRRDFAIAAFASSFALAGCDSEPKPSPSATLTNNSAVHEAVKVLVDAASSLESAVGQFEDNSWREVVPEVEGASSDVASAVSRLRTALGYSDS